MPRFTLKFAFSFALALAASPALAQVAFEGSVLPANPFGTFGIPSTLPAGTLDANADAVLDFITTDGNGRIALDLLRRSPTDPTGGSGDGLAWNAEAVWRGYEARQNILVGDLEQSGRLSITGGAELRYQYLVLGGISEAPQGASGFGVDVSVDTDDNDFILSQYLAATSSGGAFGGRGGDGTLIVSGAGSLFNNDPNLIPFDLQVALNLGGGATGAAINDFVADLPAATQSSGLTDLGGVPFMGASFRQTDAGDNFAFDVIVGLSGTGRLEANNGGRVEIQDALMVGVSELSTGAVVVDGAGSFLVANGREELQDDFNVAPTTGGGDGTTSFVGGAGSGSLVVRNGGGAEFRNGLSIGRGIGGGVTPLNNLDTGSGTVTVAGEGSTLRVNASAVTDFDFDDGSGGGPTQVALAVGEYANDSSGLASSVLPENRDLQAGQLTIADGATVTTGFNNSYGTTADDANVVVGNNGVVTLDEGSLVVGNMVFTDGQINGAGTVVARGLETSVHSTIRGGDPNAQNPQLGGRLNLVLNGEFDANDDALVNRGRIEGFVDIDATNAIRNTGEITGTLDIDTAGQLSNGADLTSNATGENGGTIRGGGVIQSATFINHRRGQISVGQGEALQILATAPDAGTVTIPGAIIQDGTTPATADGTPDGAAPFFQANLGSIDVNGGTLEVGRLDDSTTITTTADTPHQELFRNARFVDASTQDSLGVITSNDGDLTFRNGVYNTGVLAFTGGDNTVVGRVLNAGSPVAVDPDGMPGTGDERIDIGINYGTDAAANANVLPGVIVVSGAGTTATFVDTVVNDGLISVGPFNNVVNFLANLEGSGVIEVALDASTGAPNSAYLTVAGTVDINGAAFTISPVGSLLMVPPEVGFTVEVIDAAALTADSMFTTLDLPELPEGLFWDIIYDEANGDVRAEVIASLATGADFTGDGVVDAFDLEVWLDNAGILAGASTIQGDADLDGDVDLEDYTLLQEQLLTGVPVAATLSALATVPEPAAALLLAFAACGLPARRR